MKTKKIFLLSLLFIVSICSFSQSKHVSATTKKIVFTRDGGVCQCCGSSNRLEYDHITPFSCGGSSDASNIQLLCMKCNRSKSNSCVCKIHSRTVGTNCCNGKTTKKATIGQRI
jgi:5-methylcytosine-specific restriction endonuclease McrA